MDPPQHELTAPMKKHQSPSNKPVPKLVNTILEEARKSLADGPSSALYGERAQLSTTLNQAGTLLARLDRAHPPRKPSVLQSILGTVTSAAAKPARRSWFFSSADSGAMPDASRIQKLLKASAKDGKRLVFDVSPEVPAGQEDFDCILPEGATDPVCEPRS